jgi:hypothetical protein
MKSDPRFSFLSSVMQTLLVLLIFIAFLCVCFIVHRTDFL